MSGDARQRPTARQWAGARELGEGEFSTYPRLAATLGIAARAVRERAAREGWRKLDFRKAAVMRAYRAARDAMDNPEGGEGILTAIESEAAALRPVHEAEFENDASRTDDGADDPLGRLGRLLSRQAGLILTSAEAQHGVLNKTQLDALTSLIKLAEKFETLAKERVQERPTRSDDEIAAVLERIDDRIVELAHQHAERLGAEKPDR
jgi:hypothetical protein